MLKAITVPQTKPLVMCVCVCVCVCKCVWKGGVWSNFFLFKIKKINMAAIRKAF